MSKNFGTAICEIDMQIIKTKNFKKEIKIPAHKEEVFVWELVPHRTCSGAGLKDLKETKVDITFLLGKGASLKSIFIFEGRDKNQFNIKIDVIHKGAQSKSKNIIRGVLSGESRAEVLGNIYVGKSAKKSDAWLEQRVLLLDNKSIARLDPRLEIKTDDVRATHAATVSRVPDEELFYMQSRGIPKEMGKKLKAEGFLRAKHF